MMAINKENILNFLLNADFKNNYGYSYAELLEFLKYYQLYYKQTYENSEWFKNELNNRDKILAELNLKVQILEDRINFQSKQITTLKTCLTRRLSLWERIIGKVKI